MYDDAVLVEFGVIIDEGIGAAKSVFMERASRGDVVAHGFAAMGGHGGQENVGGQQSYQRVPVKPFRRARR